MKRLLPFVLGVALFALGPSYLLSSARAQSITIKTANSPDTGEILGSGTYDAGGQTFKDVSMAIYDGGGKLLRLVPADAGKGNWGGLAINLTSNQTYQVGAILHTQDAIGVDVYTPVPQKNWIQVKVK
jgi:hypothetical protein